MTHQPLFTNKGAIEPRTFLPFISPDNYTSRLIKPYLPRIASGGAVLSWSTDESFWTDFRVPVAFDAPRAECFGSKFKIKKRHEVGVIEFYTRDEYQEFEFVGPNELIERAEKFSDFSFTFDFPIYAEHGESERKKRFDYTIRNATWMINNSRRFYGGRFPIIGVCPGWNIETYLAGARTLAAEKFSALAVRYIPSKEPARNFWIEILAAFHNEIKLPVFLLDAEADFAQFLFKENLIFAAAGSRGVFTLKEESGETRAASVPFAIIRLAELNQKPLPLSAYRLRSMI